MILYGLKTCDTCKTARKALPDARFVDVREQGVPAETLAAALAHFGDALVNTRSTTWRTFDASERARAPLDLLADHPPLMKRPLIVDGEVMHLGWTAATKKALEIPGA